ncbi:hypothetical protein DRH14_05260 [Candidatus Shapirobacteria bacterium]|nr:MAG: hypothetical protein DRH14_05260 [Candidatus Shapirobacteria bacterium]
MSLAILVPGTVIGVKTVQAYEQRNRKPLVEEIAKRFHLDPKAVDKVVENYRHQRSEERRQRAMKRLDEAVTEGKINQRQKRQILEWQQKNRRQFGELRELSQEKREELRQQHRQEARDWAEKEGIEWFDHSHRD